MNQFCEIEGLDKCLNGLTKSGKRISQAAFEGMQRTGMLIIGDSQAILRDNNINATGKLSNSGRVQKVSDTEIEVGFFSGNSASGYAYYVENGRGAGRFPPVASMREWVHKKLRIKDETERNSIAYLIGRKISLKGTRPRPFFSWAVNLRMYEFEREIRTKVAKYLNGNGWV